MCVRVCLFLVHVPVKSISLAGNDRASWIQLVNDRIHAVVAMSSVNSRKQVHNSRVLAFIDAQQQRQQGAIPSAQPITANDLMMTVRDQIGQALSSWTIEQCKQGLRMLVIEETKLHLRSMLAPSFPGIEVFFTATHRALAVLQNDRVMYAQACTLVFLHCMRARVRLLCSLAPRVIWASW